MRAFMDADFLLESSTAKTLFHQCASKLPVVDYHCHINPQHIYENKAFDDLAEAWLGGDHYKWRLMRNCGVPEDSITGPAPGYEKFMAFAGALARAPGHPVYHWTHLELQRYFGCAIPLSPATADEVWEGCNQKLREDESLRVRGVLERSNVETVITTDDPADTLEWHEKLAEDETLATRVLPAFRPDAAFALGQAGFTEWVERLGRQAGLAIQSMDDLQQALCQRMDAFARLGCRAADQAVESFFEWPDVKKEEADAILQKGLAGQAVSMQEIWRYQSWLLLFLGREYANRGWVMELHMGALRNTRSRGFARLGRDTGYDCIAPSGSLAGLPGFLNQLDSEDALPKTLLFSLNPGHNRALCTLADCFTSEGTRGYVQQGAAWWFNDTRGGIEEQLETFASAGALGSFVGMLTDSRSFLSYPRHEYFRRILCNFLGGCVERGEFPADETLLAGLVQDISHDNVVRFFGL